MTRVVPDQNLLATATETAQKLAAKAGWRATGLQETPEAGVSRPAQGGMKAENEEFSRAASLRGGQGSTSTAFLEKRQPDFTRISRSDCSRVAACRPGPNERTKLMTDRLMTSTEPKRHRAAKARLGRLFVLE